MEVKDEREKIKEIIEEIQGQFKERQKKVDLSKLFYFS